MDRFFWALFASFGLVMGLQSNTNWAIALIVHGFGWGTFVATAISTGAFLMALICIRELTRP